jgi:dUTP pyrophosphatase
MAEAPGALSGQEIRELITTKGLITDYRDLEVQLQSAGFDLRVGEVEEFTDVLSQGRLDFSNERRRIPETRPASPSKGGWRIEKGAYYLVRVSEALDMPRDLVAQFKPRSSLVRMGATVTNAWMDPGYRGRLQFGLVAHRDLFIERDARIVQIVFFRTRKAPAYAGIFLGEGMKKGKRGKGA